MRLLYDFYSSRRNARLTLLAADFLAFSSALLFASGVSARPDWPADLPFILLWSLIPRGAASYLDWMGRPRDFARSLLASTLLVFAIAALVFCGWEMVREAAPASLRPRLGTSVVIILAWVSGFLLCVPRAYRLSDFSLASTVLLGLLDGAPLPFLWIPLFFLGLTLSSATRHLVHDILPGERRERFNLQNVRTVSALATLLGVALFSLGLLGLRPFLDGRASPGWRAGAFSSPFLRRSDERGTSPGGRTSGPRSRRERDSADTAPRESTGARRTIGYTHRLALRDLARPRFDRSLVLAARLIDEDGEEVAEPPPSWRPDTFLWRGIRFSRFDAKTSSWIEDTDYERRAWPAEGILPLVPPENGPPELRLEVIVLLPVFRNLVAPYFTTELGPLEPPPAADFYETDSFGDIFPAPGDLRRGVRYRARFTPWPAVLSPLPESPADGVHPDGTYLEFPPASEVGVDLPHLAAMVGIERGPIRERLERLEAFYRGGFRYDDRAFWTGSGHRLGVFLLQERLGDCTYFATSAALLLRAAGVSTRAVVGFLGSDLEALHPGRAYVRNMSAHSWVEVYFPDAGWYPIDPTRWVEPSLTYIPPAGVPPEEEPEPLVAREGEESLVFESADRPSPEVEGVPRERRRFEGPSEAPDTAARAPDARDVFGIRPVPRRSDGYSQAWVGSRRGKETRRGAPAGGSVPRGGFARDGREAERTEDHDEEQGRSRARVALVRAALLLFSLIAAGLLVLALFRPRRDEDDGEDEDEEEDDDELVALAAAGWSTREWEPKSPSEEILLLYHRLQLELSLTRNHRLPHQTPLEHGSRFRGGDESLDKAFAKLHRAVYSVLYGNGIARPDDVKEARLCCRRIRKLLG